MKGTEAVAELNDVDETVEVVRGEDEAVALLDGAPPAQHQIAGQAVLQGASEMLVENGVEIVVVSTQVSHLKHKDKIFYHGSFDPIPLSSSQLENVLRVSTIQSTAIVSLSSKTLTSN